jgi:hypothetical protein
VNDWTVYFSDVAVSGSFSGKKEGIENSLAGLSIPCSLAINPNELSDHILTDHAMGHTMKTFGEHAYDDSDQIPKEGPGSTLRY